MYIHFLHFISPCFISQNSRTRFSLIHASSTGHSAIGPLRLRCSSRETRSTSSSASSARRSLLAAAGASLAGYTLGTPLDAQAFENRVVPKGKYPPSPGAKAKGVGEVYYTNTHTQHTHTHTHTYTHTHTHTHTYVYIYNKYIPRLRP